MAAPQEIVDSLESVIDIFLSGVRHRDRAAFILCDNLIEMSCKTRALQMDRRFDTRKRFHEVLGASDLPLMGTELAARLQARRDLRNQMQHQSAAITVDAQYCAAAILDAVALIERLWPRTVPSELPQWLQCALRVVKLYSPSGEASKRDRFERQMREYRWRSRRESVRANALQIEPGLREHWGGTIRRANLIVDECLNSLDMN